MNNPLLSSSTLPYQMPPFDLIKDEHYAPAFASAMQAHLQEIAQISQQQAAPSFANTIEALENSGRLLDQVTRVFINMNNLISNEQLETIQREMATKLAAHDDAIYLNTALFQRIQSLHQQAEELQLDAESLRLLEHYQRKFVRSGAQLSAEQQARLKQLNAELAELQTQFVQNVQKEVRADAVLVQDQAELAGLSTMQIKAMAEAAEAAGHPGQYLITLSNTTIQAVVKSLHKRALRARIHQAAIMRGAHDSSFDNRAQVLRIAALRAERAQLLGFADYASYNLADETAGTSTAVQQMLAELSPPALANARKEAEQIQALIDAEHGADASFAVSAYDWDIYAEQVRQKHFAFDESQLKPYFELQNVLHKGVFFAATSLYGISFTPRPELPVYHPDVEVYEIHDADGSPLALFFTDFFARPGKRGGAWMNEYVPQSHLLGTLPVIGNHLNIQAPAKGEACLMSLAEVTTLFHEFGHALHGMLSKVRYPSLAGTHVPRDFVEFPSQVNEIWLLWPEVLKNYAQHYQTGAAMPAELIEKLLASSKFNQGYETTAYLAAAVIDQAWHQLQPDQIPQDVLAFEAQALEEAGLAFAPVPPRYRSTYFSHSFGGGYAAGYYAYMWSEKLDADAEQWFKENGGLTRANGEHLRQHILSRGNTADAMSLYRAFRGRDAEIGPLLQRRGLDQQ